MNDENQERIKIFNVFSDPFAKSLLRSDEMKPLLAHVLSLVTGFSESKILKARIMGGELTKDNLYEKHKSYACSINRG